MLEEKLKILGHVALKFSKRSQGKYEKDELMNEAWLRKNVRTSNKPSYLFMASRSAMIDYMRVQQKSRNVHQAHLHPLYTETGFSIEPVIKPKNDLDFFSDLDTMLERFSRTNKLITKLMLRSIPMTQIAKAVGLSASRVHQRWGRIKATLSIRYKICCLENQR